MSYTFDPIGVVRTPFPDKFGIPRQPGLVQSARGVVKLKSDPKLRAALRALDQFTHVWIVFVFDRHGGGDWKAAIRPPRLGGNRRVGVLASRSPHRPNPIGISAMALERVDLDAAGGPELHVAGVDLLDQTPVLDIKPYLAYADAYPDAGAGWASDPIVRVAVSVASDVVVPVELADLLFETLALDPRPAPQKRKLPVADPAHEGLRFGIDLLGFEITYQIHAGGFRIVRVARPVVI